MSLDSPFIKIIKADDKGRLTKKMYFYLISSYEDYYKNPFKSTSILYYGDDGNFGYLTESEESWVLDFISKNQN